MTNLSTRVLFVTKIEMPVSFSAVFTSVVTFWQNCAINIDIPEIQLPEWLTSINGAIFYFFTYLVSLFHNFPKFDTRLTLVLTSAGVLIFLGILTVWFYRPLITTIIHIADLTALFFSAYFCLDLVFNGKVVLSIIAFVICLIWLIGRLIYKLKHETVKFRYDSMGQMFSENFLEGVVPEITLFSHEFNEYLEEFINCYYIIPEVSPSYVIVLMIFAGVLLFVFSLIALGVFDIGLDISGIVRLFLPIVCLQLSVIFLALSVLKSSNCGLIILKKIEHFGYRLVMFILETLYIPIIKLLFENLIPIKFQCKAGYEPHVNVSTSDFSPFEKKEFSCIPNKAAVPKVEYRLYYDNALLYVKDVLIVNGGIILFTFVFIMLGIPYIWRKIIKTNRKFVFSLSVYGKTAERKWENIVSRLETPGIFLFQKYKMNFSNWSIIILFTKFIVMVINMLSTRFTTKISVVLPLYYIAMFAITLKYKPYLFPANNYLDEVLYIFNIIYAMFPILASFGINIPKNLITYTSLAILVFPVVSGVVLLFCDNKIEDNPTILTDEMKEYIQNILDDLREKNPNKEIHDEDVFDKFMTEMGDANDGNYDEDNFESLEDGDNWHDSDKLREIALIGEGDIDSIEGDYKKCDKFTTPRFILAYKFTQLYNRADFIINIFTTNELMPYLNISALAAAFAVGWYAKAVVETSYS